MIGGTPPFLERALPPLPPAHSATSGCGLAFSRRTSGCIRSAFCRSARWKTSTALRARIVCYSTARVLDQFSKRFQAVAQWRDVGHLSDQPLAEQIRADGIDILFDMDGHTADNRLLVFARRPAPVQITWIGYVGTTGVRAIDYLIGDRWHVPPGTECHYCERVLRMPDGYLCFEPPEYAPRRVPCLLWTAAACASPRSTIRTRSRPKWSRSGPASSTACRPRDCC